MTLLLFCLLMALVFGSAAFFRRLMVGVAVSLGLLVFLVCLALFGLWATLPVVFLGLVFAVYAFGECVDRAQRAKCE